MPQPTPPGTLSSPLLGRYRRRGAREVAANERGEEPRRGDRPSARAHLAARQPTQPECRAASRRPSLNAGGVFILTRARLPLPPGPAAGRCLLYTSDAADEEDSVDLGGRRIIKKKKKKQKK